MPAEQRRRITIGTTPIEVEIGDTIVTLRPEVEVDSDEYLDAYEAMANTKEDVGDDISPNGMRTQIRILREFTSKFVTAESAATFAELKLPLGALTELTNLVIETYGGGRPNGLSTGSATPSSPPGKPSTASAPSKGSTRRRGR